jgi:uncharacterized protein (DUF427 family)
MTQDSRDQQWRENAAAQRARFADYTLDPAHTIVIEPAGKHLRVTWQGETVADSTSALALHERNHGAVYYFPQKDVRTDLMDRTAHATHCPYKGDASYWSLKGAHGIAENAVWAYQSPIESVADIKDHMAFYLDSMGKDFGLVLQDA